MATDQQKDIRVHGAPQTQSPVHGGLVPPHGGVGAGFSGPTHGKTNAFGPELIVNGVGTSIVGWTMSGDGIFSIVANRFRIQSGASNSWSNPYQIVPVEIGVAYRFSETSYVGTAQGQVMVGNSLNYSQYFGSGYLVGGSQAVIIVPTQANIYVQMQAGYPGGYKEYSGLSLQKIL